MDQNEAIKIAQRYASVVSENYKFSKIILFGSYINGNFKEESDIDIAIVFKDYLNFNEMQINLMRLRRAIDSRIEPHPFRERDFDISNPLANAIINYGKEIIFLPNSNM